MRVLFSLGLCVTTIALSGCHDSDSSSEHSASSHRTPLILQTYTPGKQGIFPVASTLIEGQHDAILVDAQFEKRYANEVVDLIRKSGKNLKYIYISHSDPDYYFGTAQILKAFPNAKVVSTAQTAYLIRASKDEKLAIWREQLAADAPDQIIIPEALNQGYLELEGQRIEVKSNVEDSAHSFLWIPSLQTALGGISVSYGSHLWMNDTDGIEGINQWIRQIEKIQALKPKKVIPGHFIESNFSPKPLDWITQYLVNFRSAISNAETSSDIIQLMEQAYPNLADRPTLERSAQVLSKEQQWKVASPFAPIGQTIKVDFSTLKFALNFKDNLNMSFVGAGGQVGSETSDDVQYTATELAKNVFAVYWHEPKSGANVVHVQDYNRDVVYTNIAASDSSFTHLQGQLIGVQGVIKDPSLQGPFETSFPLIGKTIQVDLPEQTYQLQFQTGQRVEISSLHANPTLLHTSYGVQEVTKNVYMLYWSDTATRQNVTQIYDFNTRTTYSYRAEANGTFDYQKGTFSVQ